MLLFILVNCPRIVSVRGFTTSNTGATVAAVAAAAVVGTHSGERQTHPGFPLLGSGGLWLSLGCRGGITWVSSILSSLALPLSPSLVRHLSWVMIERGIVRALGNRDMVTVMELPPPPLSHSLRAVVRLLSGRRAVGAAVRPSVRPSERPFPPPCERVEKAALLATVTREPPPPPRRMKKQFLRGAWQSWHCRRLRRRSALP